MALTDDDKEAIEAQASKIFDALQAADVVGFAGSFIDKKNRVHILVHGMPFGLAEDSLGILMNRIYNKAYKSEH